MSVCTFPIASLRRLLVPCLALCCPAPTALAQEQCYPWEAPAILSSAADAPFRALLDSDGDGDLDLLAAQLGQNALLLRVTLYENDGTGGFARVWSLNAWTLGGPDFLDEPLIAAGDLSGDGRDDFVVGMGSEVLTFTSNGLSFNYTSQLHSSQTLDLVIADSDGDGVGDLWRLSPSHLSVALSMGGSASSINLDVGEEFALVDTDGDALPDVMVAEMISGSVRPYELEGSLLIAGAALQFPSNGSGQLTAGDVDGDGDDDLVIFASNGSVVGRNNGSAIFDIEPLGPGGLASQLADVDGDGDLDGIGGHEYECCTSSEGPDFQLTNESTEFEFELNDGDGTFSESFRVPAIGHHGLAGAGDLDQDGDIDLVLGRCVLYSRGGLHANDSPQQSQISLQAGPDLESDGDVGDAIDFHLNRVRVNDGDGSIAIADLVREPAPLGSFPHCECWYADWSGDGLVDMLLSNVEAGSFNQVLYVNNGGGGFDFAGHATPIGVDIGALSPSGSSFAADVDGDGDLDLVKPGFDWESDGTLVWINQGSGSFVVGPALANEKAEYFGDLDGDGITDAIVRAVVPGGERLMLRRGTGIPSLLPAEDLLHTEFLEPAFGHLEVGDLNEDGAPDIAFLGANGLLRLALNPLTLGGGGGSPWIEVHPLVDQPAVAFNGPTGWHVRALDANQDGLVDLVLGPLEAEYGDGVAYYARKPGSGPLLDWNSYQPVAIQLIRDLEVGDFDGDGDVDLAGVYLHRNSLYTQPDGGERRQYGAGTAGSGGMVPTLGASGPFRVGESVQLRLRAALSQTVSALLLGSVPAELAGFPFASTTTLVDPFAAGSVLLTLPVGGAPASKAGAGAWTIPVSVTPGMAAASAFYHQVFVFDPAAVDLFSASNGLLLDYGF